jgi:calreticulin
MSPPPSSPLSQFIVKHEQNIDCGGGYVKVFPSGFVPEKMHGESPYNLMFGPDICGPGTRKVHVIFGYKGKNLLVKKTIPCKFDEVSHLYTLIVNPDNTYEVQIDGAKVESGSLYEDFDFLEPKEINDPAISKPADWVDVKEIDDPEDTKPADHDKPEHIADPDAKKPEDWDEEMDGEWEPPMIANPEYKGVWKARKIPNPAYKGEWVHPKIANPSFVDDKAVYKFDTFGGIGLDLWQVKAGTIFDDILITNDKAQLETQVAAFKVRAEGEKTAKEAAEKKAKEEEEAAKKSAEAAAKDAEAGGDEEEIDEEEEAPAKDEL